jgi:cephalosporin hydroxylase
MTSRAADPVAAFEAENLKRIEGYSSAADWVLASAHWRELAFFHKYMYHFSWLGRPIIQLPSDVVATQELIWKVKPDLIVETGIAHGGSLMLSASLLALIDYCEAAESGETLDPAKPKRTVLGIDIDIRAHNRAAIDGHPMRSRIEMIEGSSIAPEVAAQVHDRSKGKERVLVALDSNHTHAHVLEELKLYAPLVTPGSYCIVFDTVVEDLPDDMFPDRPWGKGNSPKTAVREYLKSHPEYEIDRSIPDKLLITVAPDGYLKRLP